MDILTRIKTNLSTVMIGNTHVIDLLLASLAANGHVLLEDVPGTGKTVLAKAIARSVGLEFGRIQFTPDLLPSDVVGLNYFHQTKERFVFRKGPVFAGLLLADEINRATPRTQSALLECMQERQVTVDGETRVLSSPFFVIATQNPVETLGCFPLPEAQLDRFLMKISMEKLSLDEECRLIDRFIEDEPLLALDAVAGADEILQLQEQCRKVYIHPDLRRYLARLVQSTRSLSPSGIREGVSPRGTLSLMRASQGYALIQGRDFLVPEDIHAVAVPVLAHRMLSVDVVEQARQEKIRNLLHSVPVPTEDWKKP